MIRQFAAGVIVCFGISAIAFAADVPIGEPAFTSYIQNKLQLYSPSPINLVGPMSLSIGTASSAVNLPSLKALHEMCVASPAKCDGAVNEYIQNVTREYLQNPTV